VGPPDDYGYSAEELATTPKQDRRALIIFLCNVAALALVALVFLVWR
jgi:hypothetical protein